MYVVERCAAWAARYRKQPMASEVVHHARRALIDWHAALYPGAVLPPATLLEKALAGELDRGEARLALGRQATVRAAALINATAAHTAELDDIFRDGIYHPGAPTIAAALALAGSRNLLRSIVVGYEISTRIGAAMGRAHYRYWHNTGTIGASAPPRLPRRRSAWARAGSRTPCDGGDILGGVAAGVPHGLDVQTPRGPRRRSMSRRARRARRRHRVARRHGGRGGLRAAPWAAIQPGARHSRASAKTSTSRT
jgi:hypothetical protein